MKLANVGTNTASNTMSLSEAENGRAGTTSSEQTPLAIGEGGHSRGKYVNLATALSSSVFAPPGATLATDHQPASSIESATHDSLINDFGRGVDTDHASAASSATSTMQRVSSAGTSNDGARETSARPAKQKSVRFEEGTAGGEAPGSPLLRSLGAGTTRASPMTGKSLQDLWKLGKERRTWRGSPSSGTPTYGSIDEIASDEEGGNWDEESAGEPAERGISTAACLSFHGDISGTQTESGNDGGGGTHSSDASLTPFYKSDDSPRGKRGWRGRVSKWYHDF